jgi:acetyltransferase-like isoleucine patch superfamily enzyme
MRRLLYLIDVFFGIFPYFHFISRTKDYQSKVGFLFWFKQKVLNLGGHRNVYWPVDYRSIVSSPENIIVGVDAYPGVMPGNYIQGSGKIFIGDYTQIAPNVCIISGNHDLYDTRNKINKEVIIGKYCWLGAGVIVLPGVVLGDFTIAAAGSIITKSFIEGYCVIGGNPAKEIKKLEKDKCIEYNVNSRFYGYLSERRFLKYQNKII